MIITDGASATIMVPSPQPEVRGLAVIRHFNTFIKERMGRGQPLWAFFVLFCTFFVFFFCFISTLEGTLVTGSDRWPPFSPPEVKAASRLFSKPEGRGREEPPPARGGRGGAWPAPLAQSQPEAVTGGGA